MYALRGQRAQVRWKSDRQRRGGSRSQIGSQRPQIPVNLKLADVGFVVHPLAAFISHVPLKNVFAECLVDKF